jgi:hypothetical protein
MTFFYLFTYDITFLTTNAIFRQTSRDVSRRLETFETCPGRLDVSRLATSKGGVNEAEIGSKGTGRSHDTPTNRHDHGRPERFL